MSRSGYSDDEIDQWDLIRWRGAVKSAMRGKRGQAFLREMLEALDALPDKRLIADELQDADSEVCAIGAVGLKRRVDMAPVDPDERDQIAQAFGIAEAMAVEIMNENDEPRHVFPRPGGGPMEYRSSGETPEERWQRMRDWVKSQIRGEA